MTHDKEKENFGEKRNQDESNFIEWESKKNFSTAQLLQQAQLGAEAAGAETELIHLVDYEFTDCRECYACKLKNSKTGGVCAVRDSIQPVLKKIWDADVVIVGSPVYFSYPNGQVISLLNRSLFPSIPISIRMGSPIWSLMLKILRVDLCHELQGRGDGKFHYPELLGTWGKPWTLFMDITKSNTAVIPISIMIIPVTGRTF